jgi:hypothetical protein
VQLVSYPINDHLVACSGSRPSLALILHRAQHGGREGVIEMTLALAQEVRAAQALREACGRWDYRPELQRVHAAAKTAPLCPRDTCIYLAARAAKLGALSHSFFGQHHQPGVLRH